MCVQSFYTASFGKNFDSKREIDSSSEKIYLLRYVDFLSSPRASGHQFVHLGGPNKHHKHREHASGSVIYFVADPDSELDPTLKLGHLIITDKFKVYTGRLLEGLLSIFTLSYEKSTTNQTILKYKFAKIVLTFTTKGRIRQNEADPTGSGPRCRSPAMVL